MPTPPRVLRRLGSVSLSVANRAETGLRDRLSARARKQGWFPALLPFSGYASAGTARILARVVLAPAAVEPSARRGLRAWHRLLTLESPGVPVRIEFAGASATGTSDGAGIVDARFAVPDGLEPGPAEALLHVAGRAPVPVTVHVVTSEPARGVVCDVDDTVWVTGISHPARAAWRTFSTTSATRRSVPGMAELLQEAIAGQDGTAVVYVSNGPWNLAGVVSRFLARRGFPAGPVLMTDWGTSPRRWFRDGEEHKRDCLARLREDLPHLSWVLVGDDGEHDPQLYSDFARRHPDAVTAIALRRVAPAHPGAAPDVDEVAGVPVVRGVDGDALRPLLQEALGRSRR
ncbi:App1 family protein [Rathayibacter festucae]|nr:phosphatase domain-containing protein [Rathayibacter festucae]